MFRNERQTATTTTTTCTQPQSWNSRKKGKGRKTNDAASDVTCKITSIRLTLYGVFIFTHFFLLLRLTHSHTVFCVRPYAFFVLQFSMSICSVCATKCLNNGQQHTLKLPNQFDCTFRFSHSLFPFPSLEGFFSYSISFSGFPS